MAARRAYLGDKSGIWQERAERVRKYAEEVRERAQYARLSKRQILKLAKRYERMANLAEERAKKDDI